MEDRTRKAVERTLKVKDSESRKQDREEEADRKSKVEDKTRKAVERTLKVKDSLNIAVDTTRKVKVTPSRMLGTLLLVRGADSL